MSLCFNPNVRGLDTPLTRKMLTPLQDHCRMVQIRGAMSKRDLDNLSALLRDYPRVTLRLLWHGRPNNLDFLRRFSFLRGVWIKCYDLTDIDGFRYLSDDLEFLGLEQTRRRSHSLRFLERFKKLKELYLEGHSRDFDSVGQLSKLEKLTLRSVTLPDLSSLTPLRKLWSLDLKLGGTRDLSLLPQVGRLKYLELWMIKGLADLRPISGVKTLQFLFLQCLPQVRGLPDFSRLCALRRVHIETMKGLRDISSLCRAKALEDLVLHQTPQVPAGQFRRLINHPSLKRAWIWLGSRRRSDAAKAILGLPESHFGVGDNDFKFN